MENAMRAYRIASFELNADLLVLTHAGTQIALGPKVVETLLALAERCGELVTKEALLDRVWPDGYVSESNLAQNIYVLRKTFRDYGSMNAIETVPGKGYRLTCTAEPLLLKAHEVRAQPLRRLALAVTAAVACIALLPSGLAKQQHTTGQHVNVRADRFYRIGRYYWNLRTREGVRKSLDYFTLAIDADPNDARFYSAMADANVTMGDYCFGTHRPAVYFARAQQYAEQAVALDPNSAEGHASLGFIALHQRHMPAAFAELQRAIALNRSYAPAHEWYGIALLQSSKMKDGLAQLKVALHFDPLSVSTVAWLGSVAYAQQRYSDAIMYSKMALELAPQRMDALATMGEAYAAAGDTDHAAQVFRRFASVNAYYAPEAAAMLARVDRLAHRMAEARAAYAYARAHAMSVDNVDLAVTARAMGDTAFARQAMSGAAHGSWAIAENAIVFIAQHDPTT
jgi:DNA-binding winged helix-turn-helix (wHTH) protein/Tfp pilus assembly protein PilF